MNSQPRQMYLYLWCNFTTWQPIHYATTENQTKKPALPNRNIPSLTPSRRQKQKQCILCSLLYNKKVYNLMMAIIQAETCSC